MDPVKQAVESVAKTLDKTSLGGGGGGGGADNKSQPSKKEKKGNKKTRDGAAEAESRPLELEPPPAFLQHRIEIFDRLKKKADEELTKKPREAITITMPDGSVKEGKSWETTPGDIAKSISNSLYKRTVVAQLDKDQLWDLDRPLEKSCELQLLTFEDQLGKEVFWHSSAHILGEACERRFGCSLCIGPPVSTGFYYEMALPDGGAVQEADWKPIETIFGSIVKERQRFERLELSKDDLLLMFNYNKYKQHIIKDKIPDGTFTTVYRNGPLIDLCRGPHVPDTSRIEAFAVSKNSASYFLGNPENDSLQRVYGVSFPDKKRMAEHKKFLEEAAKRDHRNIGREQELFFSHELSPGSTMWLPHGMRIVNALMTYIREQYWKRGYQEVATPNMYNSDLWKMSGHWAHYKDDMFIIEGIENAKFGLKPMNCPGHCLMFSHRERSHRELPWRIADFGVLHRNEASGALSGLSRVRRFQQDDAHIFCREDQIKDEIDDLFEFMREMYGMLGFTYQVRLSTRPEKYMGELETWNRAEDILRQALDDFSKQPGGVPWSYNLGDGAFYGPKIDIRIFDCQGRDFQCATIQLDFVQPVNFSLEYMTAGVGTGKEEDKAEEKEAKEAAAEEKTAPNKPHGIKVKDPNAVMASAAAAGAAGVATEGVPAGMEGEAGDKDAKRFAPKPLTPGCARPVMIHRAMAGSIERFMAMVIEHFAGKWPFWLSPRQIMVIPVGKGFIDYAEEVRRIFHNANMYVDVDLSGNTLQKKVRSAQLAQYNFIFVVGHEEQEGRQVNVRSRDDTSTQDRGTPIAVAEALEKLRKLKDERATYNPFPSDKPANGAKQEA